MKSLLRLAAIVLFSGSIAISAARANMLTGSVTFDPTTGLYTYDYTVDVPTGASPILDVAILVDSVNLFGFAGNGYLALPDAHSEPQAWHLTPSISFGDAGALAPLALRGIRGSWWEWYTYESAGVVPGLAANFSFSTTQGPSTAQDTDYSLYIGGVYQDNALNFVEVGHVVAPDFLGGTGLIGGAVPDNGPGVLGQAIALFGLLAYHWTKVRYEGLRLVRGNT